MVEADVEPLIDLCVQLVVLVADLLWGDPLLQGLGLCGCTILVSAADVESHKVAQAAKPAESIDKFPACD